jgi:hypothetical protein
MNAGDDSITDADIEQAKSYDVLGPAYFAARRMAEALMQNLDAQPFKDVTALAVKDIQDKLYEYVEDHLRSDLEANLQHHLTNMVERTVQALLTGEGWAMKQYPLSSRFDGAIIRAAVAKHGGNELLVKRIEELETEVTRLNESIRTITRQW